MKNFQLKGKATTRVVYPSGLFEKRTVKGAQGEPKYNAIFVIPKTDIDKVNQVKEAFEQAFRELQASGYRGKSSSALNPRNVCWVDGEAYANESDGREQFRDFWLLKFSSKFRPVVCDLQKRIITNGVPVPNVDVENISDEELADGDHVHLNISFWTYNNPVAQGIGCNVHAVMRVAAGEQIGGGMSTNPDDYFKDYE